MTRLLLRAELSIAEDTVVTHTVDVSPERITLACPTPLIVGDTLKVALSFHDLVPRIDLVCRVTALHTPDTDEWPASVTCAVVEASDDARARLATLGEPMSAAGRTYRCLLVEDNQFIRELFAYGVSKYGSKRQRAISMSSAETAEDAWQMLEGQRYDMAIVDHYLPAQSGSDLIARIRASPRHARMSVVAISVGGTEVRAGSMAAGADMFLDKPIVLRDLFDTLDRLATEAAP